MYPLYVLVQCDSCYPLARGFMVGFFVAMFGRSVSDRAGAQDLKAPMSAATSKPLARHLLEESRPEPGMQEFFVKSSPDYPGHLGERSQWEFVCSEIR